MKNLIKTIVSGYLVAFLAVGQAWGATYYASPSGSGTDCSSGSPCFPFYATYTKAQCGDTVIVNDGSYTQPNDQWNGRLIFADKECTVSTPMTIRSATKWGAVFNGYAGASNELIYVSGSYITVDGFKIQEWHNGTVYSPVYMLGSYNTTKNLYVLGSSSNCQIGVQVDGDHHIFRDSYFTLSQVALKVAGSNILVENNEFAGNTLWSAAVGCIGDIDHIRTNGPNNTYRFNKMHGPYSYAGYSPHLDCIQSFGGTGSSLIDGLLIEKNECIGTHEGFNWTSEAQADNITIRDNIVQLMENNGVCTICNYGASNVKIYNNTLDSNVGASNSTVFCQDAGAQTNSCDIKNNIVLNYPSGAVPFSGTMVSPPTNNLSYSPYKTLSCPGTWTYCDDNLENIDPLLVGYRPQSDSPARSAGADLSATGFTTDMDGVSWSAEWGIGAYKDGPTATPVSRSGGSGSGGIMH